MAEPDRPPCAVHPDRPALGACARCGSFFCAEERTLVAGQAHCAACAARADVDWLEAFRLSLWGKRDTWGWLTGLGALGNLALAAASASDHALGPGAFFLLSAVLQAGFFLGQPWARPALLLVWPGLMLVGLALVGGPLGALPALVPLLVGLGIYRDTRNRLFFRVPVTRPELEKAWHLLANNPRARDGLLLAVFGLLFAPAAPAAVVLSAMGLSRVDPTARPPVGRRGQAIAGVVLGSLATIGWLVVIFGIAPYR